MNLLRENAMRGQGYEAGLAMIQALVDFGDPDPLRSTPELGYLLENLRYIALDPKRKEDAISPLRRMVELLPPALASDLSFLSDPERVNEMADRAMNMTEEERAALENRRSEDFHEREKFIAEDPSMEKHRLSRAICDALELTGQREREGSLSPDQMEIALDIEDRYFKGDFSPDDLAALHRMLSEPAVLPMRHRHRRRKTRLL